MMEQIKKIDVHAHALAFPQYSPFTPKRRQLPSAQILLDFYEKLNIEMGVLQPLISPEALYFQSTNEDCQFLVHNHQNRFAWFCNVDPRAVKNKPDSNLGAVLEHYKAMGAKGYGELTSHLYVDDPKMENLFGYCEELELPITIHMSVRQDGDYGIIDEVGLPRLEKLLKTHPKLKIIGHSQCFWREMGDNPEDGWYPTGKVKNGRVPELLRRYENLCCDLSNDSGSRALMRDREHAAKFIEEFSDRIMYACDICSAADAFMFKFDDFLTSMRESGEISEANYRKIVRENAIRILKLDDVISK